MGSYRDWIALQPPLLEWVARPFMSTSTKHWTFLEEDINLAEGGLFNQRTFPARDSVESYQSPISPVAGELSVSILEEWNLGASPSRHLTVCVILTVCCCRTFRQSLWKVKIYWGRRYSGLHYIEFNRYTIHIFWKVVKFDGECIRNGRIIGLKGFW